MQEVKFLHQNIKLEPARNAIKVVNENLFEGTDGLRLEYRLYREGIEIHAGQSEVSAAPQSETLVPIELPDVRVVTVAGRQMGVGGDDSWGAPVHEEYRIPADRETAFEFYLSAVDRRNG